MAEHAVVMEMDAHTTQCSYADRRAKCDRQVLDLTHLEQYTSGDETLERELLGLFKEQISAQFAAIVDAQTADDWKMAAHTLKGSARGVGAVGLDVAAQTLEEIGFAAPEAGKLAAIAAVKDEVAKCMAQIARLEAAPA